MVDHGVVVRTLPAAILTHTFRLGVSTRVHVREIKPHKHGLAGLGLLFNEFRRAGRDAIIDGLHALFGQRTGILDLLRAVRQRPRVDHPPGTELLTEAREIGFLRVVRKLRFLCRRPR